MNGLVEVRLGSGGWVERFDSGQLDLNIGAKVIVETDQGQYLGRVIGFLKPDQETLGFKNLPRVVRLATEQDLTRGGNCAKLEKEAYVFCQERIKARKMPMRLAKVERRLDGSKMTFYFTAEGRVDFRALVKDLAGRFRCRVEMRQVGVRNETKILGGLGGCGRELCCCTFRSDFTPVSVKMAKEQNLSLNPNKISGLCGRLMCCLAYEFPVYMESKKDMPKLGRRVNCPEGQGKVVRQNV
ncbi:MAG: hypothetical protein JRJ59_09535, partial [Deltaproteobacteria bacterium]|nr:hypothetical protein [Deltaproteobacteria bacterium]